MNNDSSNDNSMSSTTLKNESQLITRRNKALWRSLNHLGDVTLEDEYRKTCIALTRNTHIKRKFIESINNVHQNLTGQQELVT